MLEILVASKVERFVLIVYRVENHILSVLAEKKIYSSYFGSVWHCGSKGQ